MWAPRMFMPLLMGSLPMMKSMMSFFIHTRYTRSPALSFSPLVMTSSRSRNPAASASFTASVTHSRSVLPLFRKET